MTIQSAPTKTQIQEAKDVATLAYANRESGYTEDYSAEPNTKGDFPRKFFHGALESFTYPYVDALVRDLAVKLSEGYTLSSVTTQSVGVVQIIVLTKPQSVQAEELKIVHAETEAELKDKMAKAASVQIEAEIQAAITKQIAEEAAAEQAAKAAQRARIERDIRTAHGLK
ncbi:hypothetical protein PS914_03228 [Pseudomonas fluorescens]|uniref:hypothetical protein n=1 Tax=Pseudomonas fluorescens TaxID=294 RepID=UPI001241DDD9|nr:hypothetical protein [Pseudomonas fluorescens]VVP92120.1 hypothetical protein PS914_03228 [Pseudomonas fluorescens]